MPRNEGWSARDCTSAPRQNPRLESLEGVQRPGMSPKDLIDDDRSRKSVEKQDDRHVPPGKERSVTINPSLYYMSFNEVAHPSS